MSAPTRTYTVAHVRRGGEAAAALRRPATCRAGVSRVARHTWEVTLLVNELPIRTRRFTTWDKALAYACRYTGVR